MIDCLVFYAILAIFKLVDISKKSVSIYTERDEGDSANILLTDFEIRNEIMNKI